jgi:alpha-mannosidase
MRALPKRRTTYREADLMSKPESANRNRVTVHMIGNAHIDPVWLWRWEEGQEVILQTCRDAVANLRRYRQFVFCRSSAAAYKVIEQRDARLFEQIRRLVKEGRWIIVNGWWEQPDCNIPCGESYVRHALYAKAYFREKFDVDVTIGWNVDTFGHCGTLPQILAKSGFRYYIFFRPGNHEKALPGLFWWQAADGSRVLACKPPAGYASRPGDLTDNIEKVAVCVEPGLSDVMYFYGRGDHGGGPTPENIESIIAASERKDGPAVEFSHPERFFQKVLSYRKDFPVVAEDLQHHARGCYSAVSEVKRRNRKAELGLMTAEKLSAVAHRYFRVPYPRDDVARAWQGILFCQFHDVLAGTSIREAYERDVYPLYDQADRIASEALERSLAAIASRADTRGKGQPALVFNPCPWARKGAARVRVPADLKQLQFRVMDGKREVPSQVVAIHDAGGRHRAEVAFIAEVGGLGFRVYHILNEEGSPAPSQLCAGPDSLENTRFHLQFDPESGALASLRDKIRGTEYLAAAGNTLLVIDDPSDTWSHGVDFFRNQIGAFHARGRVQLLAGGPVCAILRITSEYGRSLAQQDIFVYADLDRIDCHMTIDWREQFKMVKLPFPLALQDTTATFDIPYGAIVRQATGEEEPGQFWGDVTGSANGNQCGVALLNDCKYGFDVKDSEMRMTVLRSPIYAFHDPRKPDPRVTYDFTDQGEQHLRYALIPHDGSWRDAHVPRRAWEFNLPLIARLEPAHSGPLGRSGALAEIKPENVVGTVIKLAEKGGDLILRFYEAEGLSAKGTVRLPREKLRRTVNVSPWEIKTVRISRSGKVANVNLLEHL